ncbi:MAG: hypothetical protein KKC46_14520 [Proteobacteria bacterium]|nr:hypothetical protein [Pseudomonadota bacterium]
MGFTITGTAKCKENGQGIAGLTIEAYDADLFIDDLLGTTQTDAGGAFAIKCEAKNEIIDKPDIYLKVKSANGDVLNSTRNHIIYDVTKDLLIDVNIPSRLLAKSDIEHQIEDPLCKGTPDIKTWTFRSDSNVKDFILNEFNKKLEKHGSILELFYEYKRVLDRSADNNDPVYTSLATLFDAGRTPEIVQGHFYGITLGIRCGEMPESVADFGNVLGYIWGTTASNESPWVGKSLERVEESKMQTIIGKQAKANEPILLGINHFNKISTRIINPIAFQMLNSWMNLHPAPESEQRAYGWEKNGGYFIGTPAFSVSAKSVRPVFQLNYRYKALNNPVPNGWLIDELVEVSPGLFLGQLCYATRKLLQDYDPKRPPEYYNYQNFGYFLLLDSNWHAEARRLFPYLDIPADAPGMKQTGIEANFKQNKFNDFTFQEPALPICNDKLKSEILIKAGKYPTLLHYLKTHSRELKDNLLNKSPYFDQLSELFNRGIAPDTMDGFYYGALISWHSAGIFDLFGKNIINLLYTSVASPFSTWTGKRFDPVPKEKLIEFTDGYETGKVNTVWGSNGQALRTLKERFVGRLMDVADIWTEKATTEEAQEFGYDVKNFFFIARKNISFNPLSSGKETFQLNYRWPMLKTIIPDCYCIDELVQIADGLFLGRLMYATNITEPYDPSKDPEIYRYGLFGYFLLMDSEWQKIRLSIGFDLENV